MKSKVITQEIYDKYITLTTEYKMSQRTACKTLNISRGAIQAVLKHMQIGDVVLGVTAQNDYSNWKAKDKPDLKHMTLEEFKTQREGEKQQGLKFEALGRTFNFPNLVDSSVKKIIPPNKKPTIFVIADTQCKPTERLEYMLWIGNYIANKKPDIIVHIGDHYDMPSLSSYDKGKASAEGRRFKDDLDAGNKGLELLNLEISKDKSYKPRKVFCKGNHEHRIDRYVEDNPELKGTLGTEFLPLEEYGWEVYDFLKPVEIEGIFFTHFLANPFSGKPYGGNAMNILKTVGRSFVVGHKQCLDIAIRPTIDGKQQLGIVNGAAYPFDESYKGYQGNNHFRGVTMLYECQDGFALPKFISLDHMKERYYI